MDIVAELESRGIDAERRSIYRDIKEINKVMLLSDNKDMTIEEAEEILEEDIDDIEKTVVYDKSRKGFYVRQRHYQLDDIRLLNECIYSAKFLSAGQTKRLLMLNPLLGSKIDPPKSEVIRAKQ